MSTVLHPLIIDEKNIIHFWLDECEIYATFIKEEYLEWINFDNSNYFELDEYIVTKHEVPNFEAKFQFAKEWIPLFSYYIGKMKWYGRWWVSTKDYVCFYGSAFRLLGTESIFDIFHRYFEPENTYPFKRFDICLDLSINIDKIIQSLSTISQKTWHIRWKLWDTETLYIWEKKQENKRQLLRIYNKIEDIRKKKKYKLYSEYLSFPNITRIELEVRRELARNISLYDVYDESILIRVFKNYIWLYTDIFDFLEGEKRSLGQKRKKIDYDLIQSEALKEHRVKLLISYARAIYEFGMCPVHVILREGYIQEKTKYGLWFKNYMEYVRNLKRMEQSSYRRNYALGKEQEERESLFRNIFDIFPDDSD